MQVSTLEEARALVGRTFERDGERFSMVRLNYNVMSVRAADGTFDSFTWDSLIKWLSGATEITN